MKKWERARQLGMIVAGNALYALAVCMFIVPNNLITGGSTGIALFVNRLTGCPVSVFSAVFNGLVFVAGGFGLGREFALTTALSTVVFPLLLGALENVPHLAIVTDTPLLAVLFAGLLIGCGIGLVIRAGASTGGMDIPPLILQKKLRIPVSAGIYFFGGCILLGQLLFRPVENVLYGVVLMIIYTTVLDKMLLIGTTKTEVKVVSEKAEEIRQAILLQVDRGVTLLHGRGGYLRNETEVILSIVSNRELPKVERLVNDIDPECFMVISRVSEVRGRGFSRSKRFLNG